MILSLLFLAGLAAPSQKFLLPAYRRASAQIGLNAALASCIEGAGVDKIKPLLDRGASPDSLGNGGDPVLVLAAGSNTEDVIRLLLDRGARVNGHRPGGASALEAAAACGRADVVSLLLQRGVDVQRQGVEAVAAARRSREQAVEEAGGPPPPNLSDSDYIGSERVQAEAAKPYDTVAALIQRAMQKPAAKRAPSAAEGVTK